MLKITDPLTWPLFSRDRVRARARVLARQDHELKASLIGQRRAAGLTQKQVAEMMGVSQQAINKLERYDSDPKQSTLRRYANAVGALVEHRVTPDLGQSLSLANAKVWESADSASQTVRLVAPTPGPASDSRRWSAPQQGRRVTLALVG